MTQLFNATSKSYDLNSKQKNQLAGLAADDVRRVALRTPSLFRTNAVPQVHLRSIELQGEAT